MPGTKNPKAAQALFDKLKSMGYKQAGGPVEKILPGMQTGGPSNPDLVEMKMQMGGTGAVMNEDLMKMGKGGDYEYGYGGSVKKKKGKKKK
jgi:hypothetical protein|tara:strand:- start:1127 stop:1399 length:273 start_codon:yes stop_codon:yes gene_type:complete